MTYEIYTRAEWGAGVPLSPETPMSQVVGWFVHYVGSPGLPVNPTITQSEQLMRSLQQQAEAGEHGDKYIDFPYSFAVDPAGRIFEGRGWDFQAAATYNNNSDTWAVVYLAGPDTPLTDAAKGALHWLVQEGAARKPMISFVKPHSDVYATSCPGDALRAFVPELQAHLHDSNVVAPPVVDWKAIAALVAWQKFCAATPLRQGQRGPNVAILNDLLIKHGAPAIIKGDAYGVRTAAAVLKFKASIPNFGNTDGSKFGGPAATALISGK